MMAIDSSKPRAVYSDAKAIQKINFTRNLDRAGKAGMYFIFDEAKETILGLVKGTMKVF